MTLEGHIENGVVVIDEPVSLPNGTRVSVTIAPVPNNAAQQPTLVGFLKYAGCMPDLPADFAAQHDHYLHGTPKR